MKHIYTCICALAALGLASCANDQEDVAQPAAPKGNVQFMVRAASDNANPMAIVPDNLQLYAFKYDEAASDYIYAGTPLLTSRQANGNSLTATAQMSAGKYKFIPSYALAASAEMGLPVMTVGSSKISDELLFTHKSSTLPEGFLEPRTLAAIPEYEIKLDGTQTTVEGQLSRAVGRVDVLLVRATKDAAGNYTEIEGTDVFGPDQLGWVRFVYTDCSQNVDLTGNHVVPSEGTGLTGIQHQVSDLSEAVVMGTGTETAVGTPAYKNYSNVAPADIINGSAYIAGTYLFPYQDATPTASLRLEMGSVKGDQRILDLVDKLPVERNKVTLVRVYVLGDNVFTTGVDFAVTVDTDWLDASVINGEIK